VLKQTNCRAYPICWSVGLSNKLRWSVEKRLTGLDLDRVTTCLGMPGIVPELEAVSRVLGTVRPGQWKVQEWPHYSETWRNYFPDEQNISQWQTIILSRLSSDMSVSDIMLTIESNRKLEDGLFREWMKLASLSDVHSFKFRRRRFNLESHSWRFITFAHCFETLSSLKYIKIMTSCRFTFLIIRLNKNRLRTGLYPGPRWGSLRRSPDP